MKWLWLLILLPLCLAAEEPKLQPSQCLFVSHDGGHRLLGYAVAGVFGAALSGGKYRYLDAVNLPEPKMTYKAKELQELQKHGVHVIVMQHDANAQEIKDARESCRDQAATGKKTGD